MGPCLGREGRVGPRSFAKMPAQSMRELVLTSRCRDVFVRQSFLTFRAPRNGAPMSLGGGFPDFQTSQGRSLLAGAVAEVTIAGPGQHFVSRMLRNFSRKFPGNLLVCAWKQFLEIA